MAAYNIYEAKTSLSALVEQAARGEEVIIAKAGKPMVRMVPIEPSVKAPKKRVFGTNPLGITYIAPDFYDDLPESMFRMFTEGVENEISDRHPSPDLAQQRRIKGSGNRASNAGRSRKRDIR